MIVCGSYPGKNPTSARHHEVIVSFKKFEASGYHAEEIDLESHQKPVRGLAVSPLRAVAGVLTIILRILYVPQTKKGLI